jgi:hypothetical protein
VAGPVKVEEYAIWGAYIVTMFLASFLLSSSALLLLLLLAQRYQPDNII